MLKNLLRNYRERERQIKINIYKLSFSTMLDKDYLVSFLKKNNVNFEIYRFKEETVTSRQASSLLNIPLNSIAKSVLLMDEKRRPLLVILPGDKRINQKKLAKNLGRKKLRLATQDEVIENTGYPPGGIPPVGHSNTIETIVDETLLQNDYVVAGGGSTNVLLKIDPKDIVRLQNARIMKIP